MRIVPADRTSLVPLAPATKNSLLLEDVGENTCVLSSTLKDGSVGWIAKGSSLEVFNMKSAERIAAWCFGAILKDPHTVVTAVSEVCYENTSCLAVATASSTTENGLICLLDLHLSKVTKAIETPFKVTAMETVSGVGSKVDVNAILCENLRCFSGILAVGTQNGHIYILDLCLDDDNESDEVSPMSVTMVSSNTNDMTAKRYQAVDNGRHLCMELDENSHSRGYYYFRKPDSSVLKTFVADDVFISSVHFIKQIGSLAVGFNFGCFQLWDLSRLNLEYCSRTEDDLAAVTHFAYQEPENDPRNYVYLWVSQGPLPTESMEGMCSCVKMFQACYESRNWISGVGNVFQRLAAIACVFDHFLTKDPYMGWEDDSLGSRLVACYTLSDPRYKPPRSRDEEDSFEESSSGPDLGLCVFAWDAVVSNSNSRSVTHIGVFDLNRWYHAQMPGSVRVHGGTNRDVCPFFAFFSTDEVDEATGSASLLAVHVDYQSLRRFVSPQIPPPDSFFFPSSMAMDANFLSENGIVQNKYLGVQMQVLSNMEKQGPASLLEPNDLFNLCLYSNLLPKNVQTGLASTSPAGKREALLSIALDYNLLGFLIGCVREWASGDFNHLGCNLRCVLDWAWKRLAAIKESVDKLCVVLYDWSGIQLDSQSLQLLHHHRTSVQHLNCILQHLLSCPSAVTQQGHQDLEMKFNVSSLITQHLSTVLWFQAVGLLPEFPEDEESMDGQYGYPAKTLRDMFVRRRQEIAKLHQNVEGTDLLIIDGIVSEHGSAIQDVWEDGLRSGLYPPPSLSSLLNMFLVDSVPLLTKRLIVMYLLFDLMHLSPEEQTEKFSARLQAFAQAFSIPRGWSRVIQGLWLLDHKEFEECLLFLLDPMVRVELEPWQNTRIIKSFLFHGRHKLALKFIQTRQPPLATPEDVKLKLSVLLANGLVAQAHEFQQIHRDRSSSDDLLHHLFLGCQQTKKMDKLLQLPLNDEEEKHLVEYLHTSQEPHSGELLVMYYLQRSRYIEAIRANAKLKHSIMGDADIKARERAHARNSIVDRYYNILPKVQRKLAFGTHPQKKQTVYARIEAVKPVPLSAVVNRSKMMHPISQATLIQAVMEKVEQVRGQDQVQGQDEVARQGEPDATTYETEEMLRNSRRPAKWSQNFRKDTDMGVTITSSHKGLGPFIGTPSTPKHTSRITGPHTDVHFAVTKKTEEGARSQMSALQNPLGLSPSSYSLTLSPVRNSPLHSSFHNKRRHSRFCSAEILSLLKTPPVKRKHPSLHNTPATDLPATPHSILKVRTASLLKTPEVAASPLVERVQMRAGITPGQALVERALGSLAREASLSRSRADSMTSQGTPKLLRFNVPQSPDTSTDIRDDSMINESQDMESEENESIAIDQEEEEEEENEEVMEEYVDNERESPYPDNEGDSPASTPPNVSPSSTPSGSPTKPEPAPLTRLSVTNNETVTVSKAVLPRTPVSQRKTRSHSHTPSSTCSTPSSIHSADMDYHYHPDSRPPLKSVRDRSPTPERISPKTSPHRRRSDSFTAVCEAKSEYGSVKISTHKSDHSPVFQISQGLDVDTESESVTEQGAANDDLAEIKSVRSQGRLSRPSITSSSSTSVTFEKPSRIVIRTVETESESRNVERESESKKLERKESEIEKIEKEIKKKEIPIEEPQVFELSDSAESEDEFTMETSEIEAHEANDGAEEEAEDYVMNIDESDEEVQKKDENMAEEEKEQSEVEEKKNVIEESEIKRVEAEEVPAPSTSDEEKAGEIKQQGEETMEVESGSISVESESKTTLSSESDSATVLQSENESSKPSEVVKDTITDETEITITESESKTTLSAESESILLSESKSTSVAEKESETTSATEKGSETTESESVLPAQAPLTPTRRSARKSVLPTEDGFKTPAQSAPTSVSIPTPPESAQGTPTKEQRLSSPEVVQEATGAAVVVTPKRGRGRPSKAEEKTSPAKPKSEEEVKAMEESVEVTAPSRRVKTKKRVEVSPKEEKSEVPSEDIQAVTPSRRGRPKKTDRSSETSVEKSTVPASPGRRGRPRKTDQSPENVAEKDEVVTTSPGRRGRPKKAGTSPEEAEEKEENKASSRRGRPRKADVSPAEQADKEEMVTASSSRTRRVTKGEEKREVTPSRETRQKTPPREVREITPSRESRQKTPPRAVRETTPSRETRQKTPPREVREVTPSRELREKTPTREVREVTPSRELREKTPSREVREVTPSRETRQRTPSRDVKEVTPARELRERTPTREVREITPSRETKAPKRGSPSRSTRTRKAVEQESDVIDSEVVSQTESETISESEPATGTEADTASSEADTIIEMEIDSNDKTSLPVTPTRSSRRSKVESKEEETVTTPSRRGRPRKEQPEEAEEAKPEQAATPTRSRRRTTSTKSLKSNVEETKEITQEVAPPTSPGRSSRRLRNASESSTISELSNASPPRPTRRQKKISESSDISETTKNSPGRTSRRLKKISESSETDVKQTSPQRSSERLRRISESSDASDISTVSNASAGRMTRLKVVKKANKSETTSKRTTRRSGGRSSEVAEEKSVGVTEGASRSRTASESSSVHPEASPANSPSTSPARPSEVKKSGAKVKRVPSRRTKRSSVSSQVKEEEKVDPGPLSSSSFMMQVRTQQGAIEEETPLPAVPAKETEMAQETESVSFEFSHPSAIASKPELMDFSESAAPIHTFVFSPPITRIRSPSRRASMLGNQTPSSAPSTPRLLPQPSGEEYAAPLPPTTKTQATKVVDQEADAGGDVRLLTPPEPSEEKQKTGLGKRVTRSQSFNETGISKRYNKKPKRGLKLW